MDKLIERFEEEIKKRNFSLVEMTGFKEKPLLAIMAGMAIGYKVAIDDVSDLLKNETPDCCDSPNLSYGLSNAQWICTNCGATSRSGGG